MHLVLRLRNTPCELSVFSFQTQIMYKWIEPKICREDVPDALTLPPSGERKDCPPCNPGFYNNASSSCTPCPPGTFSDGTQGRSPQKNCLCPPKQLSACMWLSLMTHHHKPEFILHKILIKQLWREGVGCLFSLWSPFLSGIAALSSPAVFWMHFSADINILRVI